MDKLWSPWRSQYIESFKSDGKNEGCIFCKAINEDLNDDNSLVIHKGELSFITLNLYPYNSGHLMVIPYRHLSNFTELNEKELSELMQLVQLSMKALEEVVKPHGFNVGMNLGKAAGAGIHQHLHIHVLPRWTGDTNFMPAIGEVKIISQDLLVTKKNLVDAINKILL